MKMYHVTTLESAKKISQDGASSSVSQDQIFDGNDVGGFYLWTDFNRAKKYTGDDVIKNKGGSPCILVFDIQFSPKDFDIDYEISAVGIAHWAKDNLELIQKTMNADIKRTKLFKPSDDEINGQADYELHGGHRISLKSKDGNTGVDLPGIRVNRGSSRSAQFLSALRKAGLLEKMEQEVFDAGKAPAVKYMGSAPIYPSEILDTQGNPMELGSKENVKESLQTRNRWLKMAGLLKG